MIVRPTPVIARRPLAVSPRQAPDSVQASPSYRPQKLKDVPQAIHAWAWVAKALWTGKEVHLPGHVPPYQRPTPAEKAAAIARGAGRTIPQPFNTGDAAGTKPMDPVNLVVTGSREALIKAFESQGWVKADDRTVWSYVKTGLSVLTRLFDYAPAPVTGLYLNGKTEDMAFNKNVDFNHSRDHFRVYHLGKDASGRDRWAIAATRDTALSLQVHYPKKDGPKLWDWSFKAPYFGHAVDTAIDGERDLVMHDLLASGLVKDWALVEGERQVPGQRLPDGRVQIERFQTDGRVCEVRLAS